MADEGRLVDPDPFSIGLGLFGIIAGGAAFLETRRQRQQAERIDRDRFRGVWYNARRSLIYFKRTTDEFETYMLEGGYGRRQSRIGIVRLSLDAHQHQAMRRMHGQTMVTAQHLADDLDDLSTSSVPTTSRASTRFTSDCRGSRPFPRPTAM